ncbi:toll/interleukin-1 receptor domain-containing protein [Parasphingopyxis sp. CP4]|uniref:toll/interleukin-1 receptor domain-containing protein n=1 Tax=Parasphingopyxis sp. CP4 TaxID=2724527 RepID=UPI00351A9159
MLDTNGISGWMAPDDIDPGRPFDKAIIEQVRKSDLIILLFCAQSDQSRHVKRELMMAENEDKFIYPVRLEEADADGLAYWLNDYQWVDWFDGKDQTIQRMINKIKGQFKVSERDEAAAPAPSHSSPAKREISDRAHAEPPSPVQPPSARHEQSREGSQTDLSQDAGQSQNPLFSKSVIIVAIIAAAVVLLEIF